MKFFAAISLCLLALSSSAAGGFSSALLENQDYWGDGKAEYLIYDAQELRYGALHESKVIHLLVKESFTPEALVKADEWNREGTYPVLKMNQIIQIPTGVYWYQQMLSIFRDFRNGQPVLLTFTSNDSCGNSFKRVEGNGAGWQQSYETYWEGMNQGEEQFRKPENAFFYDELPWLVRTLDFEAETNESSVLLSTSLIGSKFNPVKFETATILVEPGQGTHTVKVLHAKGEDVFQVDATFPHLVREWRRFDGSTMQLKHALKLDYWNYNKPGDLERALEDKSLHIVQ